MKIIRFLVIILIALTTLSSCSVMGPGKKQRHAERQMESSRKQKQEEIKEIEKQHHDRQSEATLKMMKKAKKRNKRLNRKRQKETIWQRIFGTSSRKLKCN